MKFFRVFIVLFLINLSLDIYFNNAKEFYELRMITKPLVTTLLAVFFFINSRNMARLQRAAILLALAFFCVGDIILLEDTSFYSFVGGLFLFLIAILLYSFYFYRQTTYDIDRLIPFLAVSLLMALILIYLIYDGLNNMLIPIMIYIATVLNFMKIGFLRYKNVSITSYRLVFVGTILFTITQIIVGLNAFYRALPYKDIFIMFFYGFSQLCIILGILCIECPKKEKTPTTINVSS